MYWKKKDLGPESCIPNSETLSFMFSHPGPQFSYLQTGQREGVLEESDYRPHSLLPSVVYLGGRSAGGGWKQTTGVVLA